MGLETGDFIDDLVITNPVTATDPVTEGSNHLQLVKKVLKQSFPNFSGEMTLTHTQLNNAGIKNEAQTISGSWNFTGDLKMGAIPATVGDIRLSSVSTIRARNLANDGNITLIGSNSSDETTVSSSGQATVVGGMLTVTGALVVNSETTIVGGDIRLDNDTDYRMKDVGGTYRPILSIDSNDDCIVGTTAADALRLRGGSEGTFIENGLLTLSGHLDFAPDTQVPGGTIPTGTAVIGSEDQNGLQLKGNGVLTDLQLINRNGVVVLEIIGSQSNLRMPHGKLTLSDGEIDTVQPGVSAANHHSFFNDNGEIGQIQTSGTVLQINGAQGLLKLRTSGTDVLAFNGSVSTFAGNIITGGSIAVTSTAPLISLTDTNTGAVSTWNANSGAGSMSINADVNDLVASSTLVFTVDGNLQVTLSDGLASFVKPIESDGDITAFA